MSYKWLSRSEVNRVGEGSAGLPEILTADLFHLAQYVTLTAIFYVVSERTNNIIWDGAYYALAIALCTSWCSKSIALQSRIVPGGGRFALAAHVMASVSLSLFFVLTLSFQLKKMIPVLAGVAK